MDERKIKVGIVVLAINLWDRYTKPCLDSINTKHDYRIIFVDNASYDNTKEEASKLVSDKFAHKRNEENWGCQKSWNYAIEDSWEKGCDYVLVLNNDVLLHPMCVDQLVERMERKDEDVVLVSAMDLREEVPIPTMLMALAPDFKDSVGESENPNFSAFMINRKYWDVIGEFDELFFPAYFEDNCAHYRIKLAGLKAVCYPPAFFYHFGSRTQNEAIGRPISPGQSFEKNKESYFVKWGGLPGTEKFKTPYDDPSKTIKSVKQHL